ncbi:MAG: flavocytochrome c [Anaerolineaceae bacterium]|nr:flavocytochrome c [Anaerolineaceae bacterium]
MSNESKKFSRRDFLKTATAVSAGVAGAVTFSGCSSAPSDASLPNKWDEEADVLVIGSGFAGLSAALKAHDGGAKVKILEKMPMAGGNSTINGGAVSAVNSPLQQEQGIEDTVELMYQDMLKAGLYFNHSELARMVAENCNEAVQWTINELGVEYTDTLVQFGGHSVARSYATKVGTGFGIIKQMLAKVEELGIDLTLEAKVVKLYKDESGRVVGLMVENAFSGETLNIKANKAVVLGSGGFSQDVTFRQIQDPRLDENIDCTNHSGATAEVMQEALKIDAMPVQLAYIQLGPWASPDEKGFGLVPWFSVPAGSPWGIIVDPVNGKRFVNELTDRKRKADAILEVGHPTINICDSFGWGKVPPSWDLSPAVEKGIIFKADTIEEIAEHYDIPVEALVETVETYNQYVVDGVDSDFDKPIPPIAEPMVTAPFYAARLWPKVHHCMGGLRINTDAQVIDIDGNPIPGLYAAGEITGGIHGATRLGSASTADCIVFGRIAGINAAQESV